MVQVPKGKKVARCFKCNEVGHFKWDCPFWKMNKGEKKGTDSFNVMTSLEMEDDLLVVLDGHKNNLDIWMLDSTYSHHYTSNWS